MENRAPQRRAVSITAVGSGRGPAASSESSGIVSLQTPLSRSSRLAVYLTERETAAWHSSIVAYASMFTVVSGQV
ncbi:MAG TPA: hypothetical protein VIQ60_06840, partial [Gemmatimonadaceae bacterium]